MGMALIDGQLVGDMKRIVRSGEVTFEVFLFRDVAKDEIDALHTAGDRYGEFLGVPASVALVSPTPDRASQ